MKISVYITSFNQKARLREAIDSVLGQTIAPYQIIIVDDASSDGSQRLIANYACQYPRLITPIYHTVNRGVACTRNDALHAVRGDYVTCLDGDDWFLPRKLEREAEMLRSNPDANLVYSDVEYMSEDGNKSLYFWMDQVQAPRGDIFLDTFCRNFPRRNLFRMEMISYHMWTKVGFYDTALVVYEDYDMRIRLSKVLNAAYVAEPLSRFRTHGEGLSKVDARQLFRSLDYVFGKNVSLLDDIPHDVRRRAERKAGYWCLVRALRAFNRALFHGCLREALYFAGRARYYWKLTYA